MGIFDALTSLFSRSGKGKKKKKAAPKKAAAKKPVKANSQDTEAIKL